MAPAALRRTRALLLLLFLGTALLSRPPAAAAGTATAPPPPPPPPRNGEKRSSGGGNGPEDQSFVSEYFSQSSQKLSPYNWYGNAKVFRFRVPEDTVLLRWLLQASRGRIPKCSNVEVTVHIRYGAPPVINPLGTEFPANMSVHLSYNLTLTLAATLQNSTFVNLTSPAAGDWFIAAHLPEPTGKIEVQGVSTPCSYIFQPDMFVLRMVDMPILEPEVPLRQTISWPMRPLHAKVFVPAYSAMLRFELGGCIVNVSTACAVRVTLGSTTLPRSFQKVFNCSGACSLLLTSPPWEKWLSITVDSLSGLGASVAFEMTASFTGVCWGPAERGRGPSGVLVMLTCQGVAPLVPQGWGWRLTLTGAFLGRMLTKVGGWSPSVVVCKPGGAGSFLSFFQSLNHSQETLQSRSNPNTTLPASASAHDPSGPGSSCVQGQSVIREDLDVVSVRFRVLGDADVPVQAEPPTLLLLNLNSGADSGGTLVLNLALNKTALGIGNATVRACLSAASPVLSPNAMEGCGTAFFQGYQLNMTVSFSEGTLIVPYPESDNWFLSLQLICPKPARECQKVKAQLAVLAYLTPCFSDCGMYGQCSLMRRHGYLYAGCDCKAGWSGWSCTDGTKAQSLGAQTLATLLLTLSNLLFLPAIVVALYRYYLVEASVYTFTMFFSAFYHACDQPGVVVLCIMDYDTVQYCDFLGSVVSFWVTILCMARIKTILKYVLCVLGTLLIAMSLHLDRRGVWNMMGPCLVALIIMTAVWVSRCVDRRHCYPPSWRRWLFFLFPGIGLVLVAVIVYAFMETTENYYYTHSLWHMLVASSLVFLLPPGDKQQEPWAWSRKLLCRYQICKNDREELYTVT